MLILSIILLAVAVLLAYMGRGWAVIPAYAALCLVYAALQGDYLVSPGNPASELSGISTANLVFWGIATVIVFIISILQRRAGEAAGIKMVENAYIVSATLAGTLVGMLIGEAGMIIGAVAGAFLGALAFSRTPRGRALKFPSAEFMQFLASRGLPAVVTMCMLGLCISFLLAVYSPGYY